jgi:polyisoprenoid-binding protein YceI
MAARARRQLNERTPHGLVDLPRRLRLHSNWDGPWGWSGPAWDPFPIFESIPKRAMSSENGNPALCAFFAPDQAPGAFKCAPLGREGDDDDIGAGIRPAPSWRMKDQRRILAIALSALFASSGSVSHGQSAPDRDVSTTSRARYRIEPTKSRFVIETETSGLSFLFVHDHRIEASDFSGMANFSPSGQGASLDLTVRAGSLHLIEEKSIADRASIENALREDVLETAKYPDITFKTRAVTSERRDDGTYDVRLTGELRLHGVRRTMTIPARVALESNALHAIGVFEIRQTDFKITPFSFVKGTVVIKDNVTISFDIIASRLP